METLVFPPLRREKNHGGGPSTFRTFAAALAFAIMRTFIAASFLAAVSAQDPADGWLAYSRVLPPGGKPGQRLTFIEAKWKNLANPRNSNSFYSPWFGIDTADK